MKTILSYSFVLVSVIALSRCSATEDNIAPPIGAGNTIITIAERMAVFEACDKKAAELNNLESLEDRLLFLAWLETQAAFSSVGFAEEDLYAVFRDGRVAFFVRTPLDESDSTGGRVSSGRKSNPPANSNTQGRTEDLPKSKKVSLFNGMGKIFNPNTRDAIKKIFDEAKAGYNVETKEATIANLKAVSGDAVFYIHTHGGRGHLHEKDGPRTVMALWTTELVSDALDDLYKDELDKETLCYMKASNDHIKKSEWHYAITSKFVSEYMSFGENCFIYLDACNGFNEDITDNETFRNRMIEKATSERATIVGWTRPTTRYKETGQFVFDRLLAPYLGALEVLVSQEDPFQRPFDIHQVLDDMLREGLGVSPDYRSELMCETTLEDEILLRPTIESMEIDEYTSTLTINGLFPLKEGKVHVNGVSAVNVAWSPYMIACIIPETGEGSFGDVVVTSADGIKSNTVPLTEWIIKLNFTADDNGIKFSGVCDLRLRADIHPRRSYIGEEPHKPTYEDHSPSSGHLFNVKGSSAVYTVTGRKFDACNIQNCFTQYTESPTPKSGRLAYSKSTSATPPLFAMYNWGPEMKSIKISYLTMNVDNIPLNLETRIKCGDDYEVVVPADAPYLATFGFPTHELDGSITIEIADNYNMRPDSWNKSVNRPWSNCSNIGLFKQTAQWEFVRPNSPPTKETAAREAADIAGN